MTLKTFWLLISCSPIGQVKHRGLSARKKPWLAFRLARVKGKG